MGIHTARTFGRSWSAFELVICFTACQMFFPGEYFSPWTQLVEELEEVRADPETSVRCGRNTHLS